MQQRAMFRRMSRPVIRSSRNRIEQSEQQKARDKSADMRLPGDRLFGARDRERAEAEQKIQPEPDNQKNKDAPVAQRFTQRQRRQAIDCRIARPGSRSDRRAEMQIASTPPSRRKSTPMRRPSAAIHRHASARCASGAGRGRHREKSEKAPGAEAARHRRAEREQPDRIEAEMHEIGVDQRVGDEGPDVGRKSRPASAPPIRSDAS